MDTQEKPREYDLPTSKFESLLDENYKLFAIVGVFGALTVYLFNLRSGTPNGFVNWGVAGALIMFLISSLTLLYKFSHRLVNQDELAIIYRIFTAAIVIGLVSIMYSVLGVVSLFIGEFIFLIILSAMIVIYAFYLWLFPWEKFHELEHLPDNVQEKISNAPTVANTWAIFILLMTAVFLPDLPSIGGYNPFPLLVGGIIVISAHYLLSHLLRTYHLRSFKRN